jgi:hypothetical protein
MFRMVSVASGADGAFGAVPIAADGAAVGLAGVTEATVESRFRTSTTAAAIRMPAMIAQMNLMRCLGSWSCGRAAT